MSLVFCDGFDHYGSADIAFKWQRENNQVAAMSATTRFTIGQSLALPNAQSYVGNLTPVTYSTMIVGVAFLSQTLGSGTIPWNLLTFLDNTVVSTGTVQFNVALIGHSAIGAYLNTTLINSVPGSFGLNWHYLEVSVTFHPTAGAYTVKVDGTMVLAGSGINTAPSGNAFANWYRLGYSGQFTGSNFVSNVLYDDFYVLNTLGASNNGFIGEQRIYTQWPNNNGAFAQFARTGGSALGNFTAAGETVADDDTSYNASGTPGAKDSYRVSHVAPPTTTTFQAGQLNQWARRETGLNQSRSISPYFRNGVPNVLGSAQLAANAAMRATGGSPPPAGIRGLTAFTASAGMRAAGVGSGEVVGSQVYTLATTYLDFTTQYDVSPLTSSAFTLTELNAIECGTVLIS